MCLQSTDLGETQLSCLHPIQAACNAFPSDEEGEPFAPFEITDQLVASIFSATLPAELLFQLASLLLHRRFDELWKDPALIETMHGRCLFCGIQLLPAELALHLREVHSCSHESVVFLC